MLIKKKICNNCRWYPICIDPCDNCEIYNSIKFRLPNGEIVGSDDCEGDCEIVEETLCPHEQHDRKCNKIVAVTCEEFEYPLDCEDVELIKIMKSLS